MSGADNAVGWGNLEGMGMEHEAWSMEWCSQGQERVDCRGYKHDIFGILYLVCGGSGGAGVTPRNTGKLEI